MGVCAECGECSDPQIANTSPPTVSLPPTVTSSPSPPPTVSRGPTSSQTSSPTRSLCIGVRDKYVSDDFYEVDCTYYAPFSYYCSIDTDIATGYYANDVCAECGMCFEPLIANTSPPTVTFLPIEGSTCSDTCGAERELVNNDNIQERILEYYDEGKMKKIHCLNTSNITKMNYLLRFR